MARRRRDNIDDMVEQFGYDYVIGFCLCSEYDLQRRIVKEQNDKKRNNLEKLARFYKYRADDLTKERFDNGL